MKMHNARASLALGRTLGNERQVWTKTLLMATVSSILHARALYVKVLKLHVVVMNYTLKLIRVWSFHMAWV